MKLDHERLEVYEEVAVYEYVNEYEYGGEVGSAAPRLRRSVRLEPIGVGIGIGIEDDMSFGHERLEVYRAAIESAGRVHRATDRCRSRFRPRGEVAAMEMPNEPLHQTGTKGPSGPAGSVAVRRRLVSFGVRPRGGSLWK